MDNPNKMVCRMCLLDSNKVFLNIYSSQHLQFDIALTIARHFWFEPKTDDGISNLICVDCWEKIADFHTYYLSVEETQRDLSRFSILSGGRAEADVKVKVEEGGSFTKADNISFIDVNQDTISNSYDGAHPFLKMEIFEGDHFEQDENASQEPEDDEDVVPVAPTKRSTPRANKTTKTRKKSSSTEETPNDTVKMETVDDEPFQNDSNTDSDSDYEPLSNLTDKIKSTRTTKKAAKEKATKTTRKPRSKTSKPKEAKPKTATTKPPQKGKYSSAEYLAQLKEDDMKIANHMKLKCDICHQEFKTFVEVKAHYREEHQKRGYVVCCNKRLYKRVFLVDHVNVHINPEFFRCDLCDKNFADRQCMQLHMIRHQSDDTKLFPCDQCPRRFAKQYMLEQHRLSHIPEEEREHKCPDCGKGFPSSGRMQTHRKYVHEKLYGHMCHICAKVISGKEQFAKHQLEHAGMPVPREECPVCGAMLKTKQYLRKHLRLHTEKDMEHKCKHCGKIAPSRGALKSHIHYVHSTNRTFQCSVCEKAFKKAIVLREHMTTHTGEVLYKCPHCTKTFNSHANMHAHIKRNHRKEWEEGRKTKPGTSENSNSAENPSPAENLSLSENITSTTNNTTELYPIQTGRETMPNEFFANALGRFAMQQLMNRDVNYE